MTSRFLRAGIIAASAIFFSTFAAHAADLRAPSYKSPAYVAPAYFSWSGFYVGLNAGYGFGKSSWDGGAASTGDFNVNGALAGVTLGYNFQTGVWVWGIEGDLDWSGMKGSTSTFCAPDCETKNDWLGTARARIGYAGWTNWMPYLTGGAAFGDIKGTSGPISVTKTAIGWTAGAGVEYALWSNWSVKAEYLYVDLGKETCDAATCGVSTDIKFKTNIVRAGINYRF